MLRAAVCAYLISSLVTLTFPGPAGHACSLVRVLYSVYLNSTAPWRLVSEARATQADTQRVSSAVINGASLYVRPSVRLSVCVGFVYTHGCLRYSLHALTAALFIRFPSLSAFFSRNFYYCRPEAMLVEPAVIFC